MERKYTFSLNTVNKYCYNEIWGYSKQTDLIEREIQSHLYHVEYKKYLETLINKYPEIEPQLGNLLSIMEHFMKQEQGEDQYSFLIAELYEPLKRMQFLQKIIESPDSKFKKVEVIVNQKPINPLNSDFISSEFELNKILIESILRDIKAYFNDKYQGIFFDLFNRQLPLEDITAKELKITVEMLETKDFNYKSHKINLEKEMIQIVLDYLNNETNLNPRGLKMTKPLATVIYYILSIFKVITKPQKESDITNYIRDMHKNPKLSV